MQMSAHNLPSIITLCCSVKKWMEGIVNQSELRYWSKIEPKFVHIVEEINSIFKEEFLEYDIVDSAQEEERENKQEDNENQLKKEDLKCREGLPPEKSLLTLK